VGPAGLLVEPRDPDRLAVALSTIWADDAVHGGLAAIARERAEGEPRTWADVAHETRAVYAEVARPTAL
jgi:glycosyltransferase involved in cell wall biosynthesis